MRKPIQLLAPAAVVMQSAARVNQPASGCIPDGPSQFTAPTQFKADRARFRSTATVTQWSLSAASPALLLRESAPVDGVVRNGNAMGERRLGKGNASIGERIPLVRSRAKRQSFAERDTDEAGRDVAVVVEELRNGTSRTEGWRDVELLDRVTDEYRGASGQVRQVLQETFANGKAMTRLEIAMNDNRVVDAGDADASSQLAATEPERAVTGQRSEASDSRQIIPATTVVRWCYWRTVALLAEAAAVGGTCGAAIVTGGLTAWACALGGAHLLAATEDEQEAYAPQPT